MILYLKTNHYKHPEFILCKHMYKSIPYIVFTMLPDQMILIHMNTANIRVKVLPLVL